MGIWEGIKRASKAMVEGPDPGQYMAGDKPVTCQHCGHDAFMEGSAVLNTLAKSHPGVDFGKSVTTLICDECGRVEFFARQPCPVT